MIRELTTKELWTELIQDPDLRRLGEYRVVPREGQTIFPIDIDFEGRSVHFGNGDFTDGFVALSKTKAESVDFGTSRFTDLYFDDLEAEQLLFSAARASRLYFDQAKLAECHFDEFTAPEVFFDDAAIGTIEGGRLRAGIVYLERLNSSGFNPESLAANTHRLIDSEEPGIAGEGSDSRAEKDSDLEREALVITPNEFLHYLAEDPDLSRLGAYRVVPETGEDTRGELHIEVELETLNFGRGDFSALRVYLGESKAELVDFSESRFDEMEFQGAQFRDCFLADGNFRDIRFGSASIENIFGERGAAQAVYLDRLSCRQFNAGEIRAHELRMGESHIGEMYFSRGEGVEKMYCEQARLGLLNLHEGVMQEFHFGESIMQRALINKARIGGLFIEGLEADKLYIGNAAGNEIGHLEFRQVTKINELALDKAFYDKDRPIIHEIEGLASPVELRESDEARHFVPEIDMALKRMLESERPQGPERGGGGEKKF